MSDAPNPREPVNALDAALVLGTLLIIAIVVIALLFRVVPQANLPIISSVVSALLAGVPAAYAGFRWGSSVAGRRAAAAAATQPAARPVAPPSAAPE